MGISDFAYMHGCLDLYHQARDVVYYSFAEVSKNDEFLQLSHSQLLQVITINSGFISSKSDSNWHSLVRKQHFIDL